MHPTLDPSLQNDLMQGDAAGTWLREPMISRLAMFGADLKRRLATRSPTVSADYRPGSLNDDEMQPLLAPQLQVINLLPHIRQVHSMILRRDAHQ